MTTLINPWVNLDRLSRIRVKDNISYDAFWIMDIKNQYGLMLQCDENFILPNREIKLNGIQIEIDNTTNPNKLILLLNDKKDWEIFLTLCNDLIGIIKNIDKNVITKVIKRLERWQKLLQRKSLKKMSKEEEMGLFSELLILREYIIPKYGYFDGIHSWVGALGDSQDFLMDSLSIEVKSHRSTSSGYVWISSKQQLNPEKTPLYLIVCSLTEVSRGENIKNIVDSITELIDFDNLLIEFVEKLEKYGYIPELHQELSSFVVDKFSCYEVKDDFPRIDINKVSPWIKDLKYSIDLAGCNDYAVQITDVLR
ncbi:PD-(D/E)XK motif protein [Paucisalibacillus sp. EB02]|uniref:PD-(D/E)XK motif protein n=1 Tax=Paucisalibacillus sp. EB02 TaxID=1347087 RepID=UPI001E54C4C6|nr:PD-(D/E)XK motif protein [Paucisalibacillus sp. EB02]